jgi:hypothetical protein
MANLVSSQGVVQGFRAIVRLYKRKAQIIILESRNNFGRNSGYFFAKKAFEVLNRWWNI